MVAETVGANTPYQRMCWSHSNVSYAMGLAALSEIPNVLWMYMYPLNFFYLSGVF